MTKLIFEKSVPGRTSYNLPECDVPVCDVSALFDSAYLRKEAAELPQLSEVDVLRHYVGLSGRNHGVLSGAYPLGSCTMKYNPAVNEAASGISGFALTHPLISEDGAQGNLRLIYELQGMLSEITGMDAFSLEPAAGAHGEFAGLLVIKAYHEKNGNTHRIKMLIPDSAHGTNPATASMAGFDTVPIKCDADGNVDMDDLRANIDGDLGGLMLTNPSTLGLFEPNILEISEIIHEAGGLLYYDGANLNAIMGISRPGDMGFDVVHLNLHKSFSTPHGGGGPGSGPVGVKGSLAGFLPRPVVTLDDAGKYHFNFDMPDSIGRVRSFYGNFGVYLKAYVYILANGAAGLKEVSESAVLNANYLMRRLGEFMTIEHDRICMHEFVATASPILKDYGVSGFDIAKRMLDFYVHPPTVYFPLIVKEALMFEPTETESKETLDDLAEIMRRIVDEAKTAPELLKNAPTVTPVGRLDDVKAARRPVLKWQKEG